MSLLENRKIILFLGCTTLFFPGAFVFGFPGVMAGEWQTMFQANKEQLGRLMFFILAGTGSAMYLAGRLRERFGSQKVILTGSLACSVSTFFVAHASSLVHVYLWAFAEGFFCGFVYIPCLAEFQRLFPDNKGLVAGISNLTFGGAAAIMSPVFTYFLVTKGYSFSSNTAATLSLCFGTIAAFLVRFPLPDQKDTGDVRSGLPLNKILKMRPFWYLWMVWALAGASGISYIVLAPSFGLSLGFDITQYIYMLTCFNILNGLGRLVCGRLADQYSKQRILMIVFLMAALSYLLMPFSSKLYIAAFLACFIGLAFGALFTVSAPLVTEVFGMASFGRIFGLVFTAYGFLAGFLGPWLSGIILDRTDSNYLLVFGMFALFYLISSYLIIKVGPHEIDQ